MTVKDLIALLQKFDQDLLVLNTRYSDLGPLEADDITEIDAVPMANGDWYRRGDYRLESDTASPVRAVHFAGN
jgi:hypothetical protein